MPIYGTRVEEVPSPLWFRHDKVKFITCRPSARTAIDKACDKISRFAIPDLRMLGGQAVVLADCLTSKLPTVTVYCEACDPQVGGHAPLGGDHITICYWDLPPALQEWTDATVLHELIHSCGGNDLDAYVLVAYLYWSMGAFPPSTQYEFDAMCNDRDRWASLPVGKFVAWVPWTGSVYIRLRLPDGTWTLIQRPILISNNPGWAYPSCH